MRSAPLWTLLLAGALACNAAAAPPYGFGRAPTAAEIHAWDIAIGPDGRELPNGAGSVEDGAALYATHCAACHGATGREGPDHALAGGRGSLATDSPRQTIGSFWPQATTVFDYVRRAMPFTAPGSLADEDVYALTAYLLHLNGIVGGDFVADRVSLPLVEMPNRHGFVADPRPERFNGATIAPEGDQ